jgi:hypothetical protein
VEALRTEADTVQAWPRWFVKLALRLAQLERGKAYTLTVLMVGDEPVWTVQAIGKLENER